MSLVMTSIVDNLDSTNPFNNFNCTIDGNEDDEDDDIVQLLLNCSRLNNLNVENRNSDTMVNADNVTSRFRQLFHQPIDVQIRVSVLWIIAICGLVGNVFVLLWLYANRGRRSRINLLILHLTIADLLVIAWAICPQLAWEYAKRSWLIGDAMCRLFKFMQTVAISVSNYMVVVLAVDRYCAIRRPLKKPFPVLFNVLLKETPFNETSANVSYMAGSAWALAVTLNLSNFFLYETHKIADTVYCRNLLYDHPEVYMQTYITVIAFFVVVLPCLIICYSYTRIFQKIARKASESKRSKRSSIKPGKIHLQATPTSTLPKAKAKTFKMTIVIVVSFILCGTPYFVCDLWRVYGGQSISLATWAILGSLAVSNSSTNPFVFLGFNSKGCWWWTMFVDHNSVNVSGRSRSPAGIGGSLSMSHGRCAVALNGDCPQVSHLNSTLVQMHTEQVTLESIRSAPSEEPTEKDINGCRISGNDATTVFNHPNNMIRNDHEQVCIGTKIVTL